jgi:signal peptidase I
MFTFENARFKNGFTKGDILFIVGSKPEKIEIGDVIIFNGNERNPIIHRIMTIEQDPITQKYVFSTIGDNNNGQLIVEKNISEDQIVGKAVFRIAPYIGWGKLIFYEYKRPASDRGGCIER